MLTLDVQRQLAQLAGGLGYDAPAVAEDGDVGFQLDDTVVCLRDTTVEWKSPTTDTVRCETLEQGDRFRLVQVWRPDGQAMLADDDGFRIVVDLMQLRRDFAAEDATGGALIPTFDEE